MVDGCAVELQTEFDKTQIAEWQVEPFISGLVRACGYLWQYKLCEAGQRPYIIQKQAHFFGISLVIILRLR